MQKGENIISVALAALVFFSILAIQRKWDPASFEDVASTAEDFILTKTGIRGQVPGPRRLREAEDVPPAELSRRPLSGHARAGDLRAGPLHHLQSAEPPRLFPEDAGRF